jgi:hypothetical protein
MMTAQEMFDLIYNGDYQRHGDKLTCGANGSVLHAPRLAGSSQIRIPEARLLAMEGSMWGPLRIDGERIYWPGNEFYVVNARLARQIEDARAAKHAIGSGI